MRHFAAFLFAFCMFASLANAEDVELSKVVDCAKKVMLEHCREVDAETYTVTPIMDDDVVCLYAVNYQRGGWVLMASDDAMTPVLGYSDTGSFSTTDMPVNLNGWLDEHKAFVRQLKLSEKASGSSVRHSEWDRLESDSESNRPLGTRASTSVSPLIQVNWDQSGSYNVYCPSDKDGRALVGCVAVGMAQAMSVCQYPARPVGLSSYTSSRYGTIYVNYDKESAYNWNDIMSGANNNDEVARLLYHCGVAVMMQYGPSSSVGSGSSIFYIQSALKTYFSYPNSVKCISRRSYSDADWNALLENELNNGRAVAYSGFDLKNGYGHCFNLDGTDGNGFYHVNWGWGGRNNGYFSINALRDATMDMDYSDDQSMVIGIRAPSNNPSDILLSNKTVAENMPAGTVVGAVEVESEAKNPTYSYELQGAYSPITHGYITVPFEIKDGYLVTTKELTKKTWSFTITATNTKTKASYSKQFNISVVSSAESISNVKTAATIARTGVYDLQGRRIADSLDALSRNVSGIVIVRTSKGVQKVFL